MTHAGQVIDGAGTREPVRYGLAERLGAFLFIYGVAREDDAITLPHRAVAMNLPDVLSAVCDKSRGQTAVRSMFRKCIDTGCAEH
eukprot:6712910-Alexandrium_andersonii.AAC.1